MVTAWGEGPVALELLDRCGEPESTEVGPGLVVPWAQVGRLRKHPFRSRVDRFSQLDALSQYAVVAAGHALDEAGLAVPHDDVQDYGTMLGSCYGTQESNWQFDQFSLEPADERDGLRPLVFKSTVDNVPAGWVAIAYRLRGVTTTYISGPGAGAEALWAAAGSVEQGLAPGVVVCGAERLIPLQVAALHLGSGQPSPFLAEGAAALVVESAQTVRATGRAPRAELKARGLLPWNDSQRLAQWLADLGLAPSQICGASAVAFAEGELEAGQALFEAAGLAGPFWRDHLATGYMVSAQALMSAGLLLSRLEAAVAGEEFALLAVKAEGDYGFFFLLSPWRP